MKIHIMHVPGADPVRDEIVAELQSQVEVTVHSDPNREGLMQNWLKAVQAAAEDDTGQWSFILSDDAKPLPGWQDHVSQATWYSPEPFLGLTHFGSYGKKLVARGVPYGVGRNLIWGGAVAYRRDFLEGLAEWAPRVVQKTGYPHDDRLVGAYAYKRGRRTALTARAIFDQPAASLLGHSGGGERRPAATIASSSGPHYGVLPRSARVSTPFYPEMRELADVD